MAGDSDDEPHRVRTIVAYEVLEGPAWVDVRRLTRATKEENMREVDIVDASMRSLCSISTNELTEPKTGPERVVARGKMAQDRLRSHPRLSRSWWIGPATKISLRSGGRI